MRINVCKAHRTMPGLYQTPPRKESGKEEEDGSQPHSTAYILRLCRQDFQCYLFSSVSDLMGQHFHLIDEAPELLELFWCKGLKSYVET